MLISPTAGYIDPKNNFQFCYETTDPKKQYNYLSGWCLAGKKLTFSTLNISRENGSDAPQIFDERFFCFFEDVDLSFRSKKIGIKSHIIELPIVHFGHISSAQLNTAKLYRDAHKVFVNKWKR